MGAPGLLLNGEGISNISGDDVSEIRDLIDRFEEVLLRLDRVVESNTAMRQSLDGLAEQYRVIIKWLLIVVCAIALGKGAMEMVREIVPHSVMPQGAPP